MPDHLPEDEDKRLEIMFRELATPVADEGFTDRVMQRVSQNAWRRAAVLTAAALIGGVVAIGPVANLTISFGRELTMLASRWHDLSWATAMQNPLLLGAALGVFLGPGVLRWLED